MDKPLQGTNAGLLFVNSAIKDPALSEEAYTKWYHEQHIPDIFKTNGPGAINEAYLWKALDPDAKRRFLALYPTSNVEFLQSDEFKQIPVESSALPGSGKIFELADFDARQYRQKQLYEPEKVETREQPDLVIVAGFTPADDADYEKWYQEEHLKEISGITGWRRTERYELYFASSNRDDSEPLEKQKPKFLTLHFFDGEGLPEQELAKASESEWTKKVMGTMRKADVSVFRKSAYFVKS